MAGYSGKPLWQKLGLTKPILAFVDGKVPASFRTMQSTTALSCITWKKHLQAPLDYIHYFAERRGDLQKQLPRLKAALASTGMLWISWPKQSANLATDLTETTVQQLGLAVGLVDVKVCAIDDTWSGLKFVYRLSDRATSRDRQR
jgi:hypothetical protein